MKKLIPTELEEQKAFVKWMMYNKVVKDFYAKLHNEGKRSVKMGHLLKLLGLRPGASDLFIAYPAHGYHGLWIEMKRRRLSVVSCAQRIWLERMRSVGYAAHACYGFDEAKTVVENYLSGKNVHAKI